MPTALANGSVHGGLVPPWRTLLLSGLALALYLMAGPAPELLVYDRATIAAGEWWRLVTGHLVHSDAEHALWDIAALALFGALFERGLGRGVFLSLALGAIAIDAWLWWAMPELSRYCGLSGVINALIAAGLCQTWRQMRDPLILWVAVALVVKITIEVVVGQALFTNTSWPGVPVVHAVGFAVGLLVGWTFAPRLSFRLRPRSQPA